MKQKPTIDLNYLINTVESKSLWCGRDEKEVNIKVFVYKRCVTLHEGHGVELRRETIKHDRTISYNCYLHTRLVK